MLWCISSDKLKTEKAESMKYPECEGCINRELDPFQCEDCEDACNFEPYEDDFDDDDVEDMTIDEFKEYWRNAL